MRVQASLLSASAQASKHAMHAPQPDSKPDRTRRCWTFMAALATLEAAPFVASRTVIRGRQHVAALVARSTPQRHLVCQTRVYAASISSAALRLGCSFGSTHSVMSLAARPQHRPGEGPMVQTLQRSAHERWHHFVAVGHAPGYLETQTTDRPLCNTSGAFLITSETRSRQHASAETLDVMVRLSSDCCDDI